MVDIHCLGCLWFQVLDLIEKQMRKVPSGIDALLLVGGFAGSEYLFERVHVRLTPTSACKPSM
jgi:hypothetical protein